MTSSIQPPIFSIGSKSQSGWGSSNFVEDRFENAKRQTDFLNAISVASRRRARCRPSRPATQRRLNDAVEMPAVSPDAGPARPLLHEAGWRVKTQLPDFSLGARLDYVVSGPARNLERLAAGALG